MQLSGGSKMEQQSKEHEDEYTKVYNEELHAYLAFLKNKDPEKQEELQNKYIEAATKDKEYCNQHYDIKKNKKRLKKLQKAVNENWPGTKVNEPDYKLTNQQKEQIQRTVDAGNLLFQSMLKKEAAQKQQEQAVSEDCPK